MVAEEEAVNAARAPTVQICLDLVDPVPAELVDERRHVLEAGPPVRAGGAAHVRPRDVLRPPLAVLELEADTAGDPEATVGVELGEQVLEEVVVD